MYKINIFNNKKDIFINRFINEFIPTLISILFSLFLSHFRINDWLIFLMILVLMAFSFCRFYSNANLIFKNEYIIINRKNKTIFKYNIHLIKLIEYKYDEKKYPFTIQVKLFLDDNNSFDFYVTRHLLASKTKVFTRIISNFESFGIDFILKQK